MSEIELHKPLSIYQSSAGSGKTYTLVKEYISILLQSDNDAKFKQILAVTFTNKAANEMKERVLESLLNLFDNKDNKKDENLLEDYSKHTGIKKEIISGKAKKLFSSIIHQYGYFNILTIDKFVHRVIRSFARELDLSVNFEIESDIDAFLQRSVAALLNQVGSDDVLTNYLVKYAEQLLEGDDNQDVEKRLLQLTSLLKEEVSKESIKEYKNVDLSFFSELGTKLSKREAALELEKRNSIQELIDFLTTNGWEISSFGGRKNSGWNKLVNDFALEGKYEGKLDTPQKHFDENKGWYNKAHEDIAQQLNDPIRERMGNILTAYSELDLIAEIKKQLVGFSLLNTVNKILQQVKGENNIVFLNDFNEIISKIVRNEPAPFVYEKIGTRFHHFLIDEFQDTSTLQWHNLVPLLFDSLGEGNRNLVVGDAKQAIYRWRGGDVKQFMNLPHVAGDFTYLNEINRIFHAAADVDDLKVNYRSGKSVVNFNNWLFESLTKNEKESIRDIYKGVSQDINKSMEGFVNVKILEGEKEDTDKQSLDLTIEYIEKCLDDGFLIGDITILVRKKGDGTKVAQYLEEKGYPVVSMDSIVLGSSNDVNFIVSFLKSLSDVNDEHAQVKCMRFLSGEESLTSVYDKWRIPNSKDPRYSIGIDFNEYLKEEYSSFETEYYQSLNLYDKVIYIIEQFSLNRYQPYLDQLLNTVHSYLDRNNSNINTFVEFFEEKKDKIPVNVGSIFNAIQVMTIHKSKGLQFPVVIMPFSTWSNKIGGTQPLTWIEHDKLKEYDLPRFVANLSKNSLKPYDLLSIFEEENHEAILDNLNLYYVAFTRPESRLYVHFSSPKKIGKEDVCTKIMETIKLHDGYNEESLDLTIGKEDVIEQRIKDQEKSTDGVQVKSLRQNMDISFDREAFIEDLEDTNEREIGVGVHNVFAEIQDSKDVERVVDNLVNNGTVNEKIRARVIELVNNAFKIDSIRECFADYDEVFNEAEIITATSEFYRPDKVVIKGGEAIVLDFKTGVERKSHVKQILNYAQLLEEMGYVVKKKYLLYVVEPKLIEL